MADAIHAPALEDAIANYERLSDTDAGAALKLSALRAHRTFLESGAFDVLDAAHGGYVLYDQGMPKGIEPVETLAELFKIERSPESFALPFGPAAKD